MTRQTPWTPGESTLAVYEAEVVLEGEQTPATALGGAETEVARVYGLFTKTLTKSVKMIQTMQSHKATK